MQAWTRNSSVSSQALYHRATAPPLLFEECNAVLLPQLLCHTGLLVILQQLMLTLPRAVAVS